MRLAVSGNGYASAASDFADANRSAASTAQTLMHALDHSGAMAGHTAADFAASYDDAARQGVSALCDLVDALANLGRMTEATRRNHEHAEQHAVVGRRAPAEDTWRWSSYAHVTAQTPPSAAGSHGAELPGWASWILDKVEGFVWPDSDIDRLGDAARAWRTASARLEGIKAQCLDAAGSLSIEVAPDVELAIDATRRLATQVDSLAQTFHGLGRSCDDLADQVHHHREQVLDIVHDTLRDAVVIEGIGLVLGAVTGGISAAAASSVNGARIAAIAPRIIRVLDGLRLAIGASEAGARAAAECAVEVRATFQAFLRARVILVNERGAAMPFYWYEAAKDGGSVLRRAPGWLLAQETPGHTLSRHAEKSVDQLMARFNAEPHIPFSSTFDDPDRAEHLTAAALEKMSPDIDRWLESSSRAKAFECDLGVTTGTSVTADGRVLRPTGVRMYLVRDTDLPGGFRVHTSFPQPISRGVAR